MTSPLALLALQILMSFCVMGGFLVAVVHPLLRATSPQRALEVLIWPHALRYLPLALLAPGQVDAKIALRVTQTIAWGDFVCAVLAGGAIVALRLTKRSGMSWAFFFSIVSCVDIVLALSVGMGNEVYRVPLGSSWFILTVYVPLICVSQAAIVHLLIRMAKLERAEVSARFT